MNKVWLLLPLLITLGCSHIKSAGRTIGHTSRDAAHAVGQGTKEVTTTIGHSSRDAVKSVKKEISE